MSSKTRLILRGLLIFLLIYIGYSFIFPPQVPEELKIKPPFKVGFIGGVSGPDAELREIFSVAINEVNRKGGAFGQKIEVFYQDSECQQGEFGASELIKKEVKMIIGFSCAAQVDQVYAKVAGQELVLLSYVWKEAPESKFWVSLAYPYNFGALIAKAVLSKRKLKKVAFIDELDDWSLVVSDSFKREFQGGGQEIIMEAARPDLRGAMLRLKSQNPDGLFINIQSPELAQQVLVILRQLNWRPQLMLSELLIEDHGLLKRNAITLEGAVSGRFGRDPENLAFQRMIQGYRSKTGRELEYPDIAQIIFDMPFLIRDALAAVGDNPGKISAWFRQLQGWQGASGEVSIGEDGQRQTGYRPVYIEKGAVKFFRD